MLNYLNKRIYLMSNLPILDFGHLLGSGLSTTVVSPYMEYLPQLVSEHPAEVALHFSDSSEHLKLIFVKEFYNQNDLFFFDDIQSELDLTDEEDEDEFVSYLLGFSEKNNFMIYFTQKFNPLPTHIKEQFKYIDNALTSVGDEFPLCGVDSIDVDDVLSYLRAKFESSRNVLDYLDFEEKILAATQKTLECLLGIEDYNFTNHEEFYFDLHIDQFVAHNDELLLIDPLSF